MKKHPRNFRAVVARVLVAALALPAPSAFASGGLVEIIAAAETYNANHRAQLAALDIAREGESVALSGLLPQVSGAATFPDGDAGGRESYSISLSQQILNLSAWRNWRAEQSGTAAAERDFDAALQGLRLTVATAWLDAQAARENLKLTEARLETVAEQLKRAELLEGAGEGTRVDVLSSRARLDSVRAELVTARNALEDARANVSRLAGQPPKRAELSGGLLPSPPLEKWLEKIRDEANELAAARERVEQARRLLDAADAAVVPRIVLSMPVWEKTPNGNGGGGGGGGGGGSEDDFTIRIEQSFFTGGRVSSERRRISARLRQSEAALLELRRSLEESARSLHRRAAGDLERARAQRAAEESARAALDTAIIGYEAGVRILADVLNAEEALFDARVRLSRAQYDHLAATVRFRALAGALNDAFISDLDALFIAQPGQ